MNNGDRLCSDRGFTRHSPTSSLVFMLLPLTTVAIFYFHPTHPPGGRWRIFIIFDLHTLRGIMEIIIIPTLIMFCNLKSVLSSVISLNPIVLCSNLFQVFCMYFTQIAHWARYGYDTFGCDICKSDNIGNFKIKLICMNYVELY